MIRNFAFSSIFALSSFAGAATIPYQAVIRAELAPLATKTYEGADLFLDGRKGLIELTLHGENDESLVVSLEDATSEVDDCGVIITSAEQDLRPVDGPFSKITIRHNQNNTCPTLRPLKAIEVYYARAYYDRFKGKEVLTEDSFETDKVALINPGSKGDIAFQGQLNSLEYKDKILTLGLSYSGGCKSHSFDLKWGECKKVKLLSSEIEQCEVAILHTKGSDDLCKAYITAKHEIDLSGLAKAYILKIGTKRVLVH